MRPLRVVLAVAVSVVALVTAARFAFPADDTASVRRQLSFLRSALDGGAAGRAQSLFPEGYFFSYALYGLSQVDVGLSVPPGERSTPLREARWALAALESDEGRAPFAGGRQEPAYGVFYRGWTNWLRGGIVALDPDGDEVRRFERDSAELAAAFTAGESPFLTSYPGLAWPCDNTVAIASLRLHDALRTPRYQAVVDRWLTGVRDRLDPATGLIPHRVDATTGMPVDGARATSLSLMTRFLVDVEPGFAREQYTLYRDKFVVLGGAPAVREYPAGQSGAGDVDSGPLILGVSLSATAVTLGAARVQGDDRLADAMVALGEVAGVPVDTPWTRRYAAGALPIGDAFVAWSKSARPWVASSVPPVEPSMPFWWRVPALAVLLLIALAPWVRRLRIRTPRRRSDRHPPTPGRPSGTPHPATAPR